MITDIIKTIPINNTILIFLILGALVMLGVLFFRVHQHYDQKLTLDVLQKSERLQRLEMLNSKTYLDQSFEDVYRYKVVFDHESQWETFDPDKYFFDSIVFPSIEHWKNLQRRIIDNIRIWKQYEEFTEEILDRYDSLQDLKEAEREQELFDRKKLQKQFIPGFILDWTYSNKIQSKKFPFRDISRFIKEAEEMAHALSSDSVRLRQLARLNKAIHYNPDVKKEYSFDVSLNNKQQWDAFQPEKYLLDSVVYPDLDSWIDLRQSIRKNQKASAYYKDEYRIIITYCEPLRNAKHAAKEQLLVEQRYLRWVTDPVFTVRWEYISPAGRNQYSDRRLFSFEEFSRIIAEAEKRQQKRSTSAYERGTMTYSLRYDVLKRDNFRCQLCGRSAKDGVRLHVDHIKPVSQGGKTVMSNLRTLCEECNRGKAAKYDPYGVN